MNPVSATSAVARTADVTQPSPRLKKAAQDFEAILLSGWLEKMQESFVSPEQGEDPAHSTLASMGTEAIASALAARGGIGIARMIVEHFAKGCGDAQPGTSGSPPPVTGTSSNQGSGPAKVFPAAADEFSAEHCFR